LRGNVTEFNSKTGEKRTRPIKPEETVWFKYEKIFTNNYKSVDGEYKSYLMNFTESPEIDTSNMKYRRVWTQPINNYGNNYNLFDVSLAPVLETEFNANKSQLKVIESGFHKKPIIASETEPYTFDLKNAYKDGNFLKEGNALTVPQKKSHKLWAKYMKLLIENPNMIEDLGNRLYETVKDKYSLQKVCKDRIEFFKSII
jgi:glycosyltransferase involved in cell wall biosynthesis